MGAVVLHHGWPAVAPAGYMGVDVFFVVSGFLITGLLLRETETKGRIALGRFYERRARRILPAAMVVLATVSALTIAVVPQREWQAFFREFVASALYFENWLLAADSQDPARTDLASTPVQHFWSLSVEEQFYLVWPLLIIAALWFAARRAARRGGAAGARPVIAVVLGTVTAASLALCIALTAIDHNLAYFSTLARGWEFGVGGLLAMLPAVTGRERLRAAASWAGLALIVGGVTTFRTPEAFPGAVALVPVAGTVLVIAAGMPAPLWSPAVLARLRPVQWMGDISYSLYLWHWPIFMFTPYLKGRPSPAWLMVVLVALSFAVAAASKRWIEDPLRARPSRSRPPTAATLAGLAAAAAAIVAAGVTAPMIAAEQTACPVPGGR